MTLSTTSAAVHITPVVIKTLATHYRGKLRRKQGRRDEEATDDVLFDEAFHIVKAFIDLTTYNTVESLQKFCNTHIPSPPWSAVSPVLVPLSSCNDAADILVDWFGKEELKKVVGGERWWQVRGLDGIESEWITENSLLSPDDVSDKATHIAEERGYKLTTEELDILRMDKLERVMLYVHGGGYFWGSINTHRYQIIRYARKIKGRAFAVNYRKAPQYPWPCPLHDALAAYLYLTQPPLNALHSPVPPSKLVLAGDSAGGGICLTMLTVLRDMGLPMPAGAVLISPWVDMTHSFPSVMNNTATDIIPPHGFLNKPSPTWPIDPEPRDRSRVAETETWPPPDPGHADTLKPGQKRLSEAQEGQEKAVGVSQSEMLAKSKADSMNKAQSPEENLGGDSQLKRPGPNVGPVHQTNQLGLDSAAHSPGPESPEYGKDRGSSSKSTSFRSNESWEPSPPKVFVEDPNDTPLEIRSQIQHYATNEQLTHPLVSPILQGSLGNLCPLYILAGDHEVLRDEVIYLAHRAAMPNAYSPRSGALRDSRRQLENMKKFKAPTPVHLEVFDGMCHVLTVFTFTPSAKYAYRSIAEFVKHVTNGPEASTQEDIQAVPFPELVDEEALNPPFNSDRSPGSSGSGHSAKLDVGSARPNLEDQEKKIGMHEGLDDVKSEGTELYEVNKMEVKEDVKVKSGGRNDQANAISTEDEEERPSPVMIRQRIDVHGKVREMEGEESIPALQVKTNEVGLLKQRPAERWVKGQEIWDQRFKNRAMKVTKQRRKNEAKYEKLLERAKETGLVHDPQATADAEEVPLTRSSSTETEPHGMVQNDRRWGPLDLEDENPPSSAIAARRDTLEAIALLRKTVYHTVPKTVTAIPKKTTADAIKAAFDPTDHPTKPPHQSIAEEQTKNEVFPMHGLHIWSTLMGYFMHRSSRKAKRGKKHAAKKIQSASDAITGGDLKE